MALMYFTTYSVFFLTGAFLGASLASFALDDKKALLAGSPLGLVSLWVYHSGLTEEKLDGTFVWWGMSLDATGLMIAYFVPCVIFGLVFYVRFRTFLFEKGEDDHS